VGTWLKVSSILPINGAGVAELERDGHDTASARELLALFEDMQTLHVAHRDRLVSELEPHSDG
jgi:hypothetical protein